jgi:RsiW-degrading membrane proteinase PrsW (M82 family)
MTLSRQPAYWLFVLLVLTSIGLVGAQQLSYLTAYPQAWFLSVVLLAAVAIPVGIVIYRLDQFEPEPASLIVVALVWGGVVSLAFAAVVNTAFLTFPSTSCQRGRWIPGGRPSWRPSTRSSTRAPDW